MDRQADEAAAPETGPSSAFEARLGAFLALRFPELPGGDTDSVPGILADMQLAGELAAALGGAWGGLRDSALPVPAHLMPSATALADLLEALAGERRLCAAAVAPAAQWARAHLLAARLRERGIGCKKLFVHGGPAPHALVLVYVRAAAGEAQALGIDVVDGALALLPPPAHLARLAPGARLAVEVTAAAHMRPPSLCGVELRDFHETVGDAKALLRDA